MTSAREEARAAAEEVVTPGSNEELVGAAIGASVASDVWEPIVRSLLDMALCWPTCGDDCDTCAKINMVITRAKEALGE